MNIDKYRMQGIEFHGDEWEFIHSLVYLKYGRKINVLEMGEGNYSLLFAICQEHADYIKKILSVDALNKYEKGETEFYEKKRIFSSLANRNFKYVEHFQGDCFADDILKVAHILFTDDLVDLFVVEYMNDDQYMDQLFDTYELYFSDSVDIYYHNLNKSQKSIQYFEKISDRKKSVVMDAGPGTGIIKNI